jgi:hypothetical protein
VSRSSVPRPRRARRAWLAAGLALAALAGASPAQEGTRTPAERVQRLLDDLRADPESDPDGRTARRLAALGPVAIPALCDVVEEHQVARLAGGAGRTPMELAAVLDALGALDADELRREVRLRIARRGDQAARAAAALALAAPGNPADLELVLEIALPALDPDGLTTPFGERIVDACVVLQERDGDAWQVARGLVSRSADPARLVLVRAAARAPGPEALAFLGWCVQAVAGRRLEVLGELQHASLALLPPADAGLAELVRRLLDDAEPQIVAQAALLCGRFEDGEATERLIELLAHPSSGVRSNALWSLQRISGLGLREDASRWATWHAAERAWWSEHFDATAAALGARDPVVVTRALLELGRRRLHRDRIGVELGRLLDHPDHEIVRLAAATLASVRSRASLHALVDALDVAPPDLRPPLERAFRCAAGPGAPEEPARWRAWIARFAPRE